MFKKSHINLAQYLVTNLEEPEVAEHRKAFYLGSILPDCKPSFITKKHRIDKTFDVLKKEVAKITNRYDAEKGISRYYCRHLGVVTHYLADYFTYPHNTIFQGGFRAHCAYEKELQSSFRDFVSAKKGKQMRSRENHFLSLDDLFDFITRTHDRYLQAIKKVQVDIQYIIHLVFQVVDALLGFLEEKLRIRQVFLTQPEI